MISFICLFLFLKALIPFAKPTCLFHCLFYHNIFLTKQLVTTSKNDYVKFGKTGECSTFIILTMVDTSLNMFQIGKQICNQLYMLIK